MNLIKNVFFAMLGWSLQSFAALAPTNSESDEIPPLRPPKTEILPGYWEEHRSVVILAAAGLLLLTVFILWLILRPRGQVAITPEAQARKELDLLMGQPENGMLLSQVSQIIRRYVSAAFKLPAGELTTTEFCKAISTNESVGAEISAEISEFLRRCDQRKFAPISDALPINAVAQALQFISRCEARCAELRKAEQNATKTAV